MQDHVVNPDRTASEQGLKVGDKVCYIKHWVQDIKLVCLGEVKELVSDHIARIDWLDRGERLQFVRHLVKLDDKDTINYLEEYKRAIEQRKSQQEARDKLRECVEPEAIVERPVQRDAGMRKPRKQNPLKKKQAKARRTEAGSLKSRMLRRGK